MIRLMTEKLFHMQPWTSEIQEVAQSLINEIHAVTPELEVLFMGAAALKLPGKNDIDLDILCNQVDLPAYAQKLLPILGTPKNADGKLVVWEFILDGFEIDAILSDPKTSHVPLQRKRFEILRANPKLQEEYRQLKQQCDGLLYDEYEKRKIAFLEERVLSSKV